MKNLLVLLAVLLAGSLLVNAALGWLLLRAHVRVRAMERSMEIELAEVEVPSCPIGLLIITIRKNGRYNVSGKELSKELSDQDLRTVIRRAVAENHEQKVIVRSDPSVEFRHVTRVMAICGELGVLEANIGLTYRLVETQPHTQGTDPDQ